MVDSHSYEENSFNLQDATLQHDWHGGRQFMTPGDSLQLFLNHVLWFKDA